MSHLRFDKMMHLPPCILFGVAIKYNKGLEKEEKIC